jgi:heme-degrading monooxygenase HmoA
MNTNKWHIAQLNIATMLGKDINDPVMAEFVAQLDTINVLAEQSNGFIWRLKSDDGNATSYNPYHDERIIVNFSVWESADDLKNFVYKSAHTSVMKDRKKWFENFGQAYYVIWNIPAGSIPSLDEAVERLDFLQKNGPSVYAFDFKNIFDPVPAI